MNQHLSAIALTSAVLASACASTQPMDTVAIPGTLSPGPREALVLVVPATGVQIYECRASSKQPGGHEWAFVAPEADLFDRRGNRIGRHYGGPHWEADDGSKIVGHVKARAEAPRNGAIPWLLLGSQSVGPAGSFSKVTSIQRVHTVGGLPPEGGCSQASLGHSARVGYTAYYYFFTPRE